MFLPYQPSEQQIREYLAARTQMAYSYEPIGATRSEHDFDLRSFKRDQTHVRLGTGEAVFHAACTALREWRQLRLGWVTVHPAGAALAEQQTIAVVACTLGIWSVNPARVLYVIDEPKCFGFAYGTLPGHAAAGEERFIVSIDESTGEVTYDVLAFSQPDHWLAKLAYPYLRSRQRRFSPDSVAALRHAVKAGNEN